MQLTSRQAIYGMLFTATITLVCVSLNALYSEPEIGETVEKQSLILEDIIQSITK